MCVCHGFPGAEGQSMLGRVGNRRDRASRLGKGKGAVELRNQRGRGIPWSPAFTLLKNTRPSLELS